MNTAKHRHTTANIDMLARRRLGAAPDAAATGVPVGIALVLLVWRWEWTPPGRDDLPCTERGGCTNVPHSHVFLRVSIIVSMSIIQRTNCDKKIA